jgi:hypothetical protein
MQYLLIEYADPMGQLEPITLHYRLRNNPIVPKWIERIELAQKRYEIDDPKRFYGFGPLESQQKYALNSINECIDIINAQTNLIDRKLMVVNDQDTLNYLHHIFEINHGLLDKQVNKNIKLMTDLSNLNILIHRCEAVSRNALPRHVITWFGLPKDKLLDDADYDHMIYNWLPGTVFLNYCEIGKTMEDLAIDNDHYIADEAFQPFKHYSADFVVYFFERTHLQAQNNHDIIYNYYQKHKDRFSVWQPCYSNGKFPLADIEGEINLDAIGRRQLITNVQLI